MKGHSKALPNLPWEPVVQEEAGAGGERGEASHEATRVRGWFWGAQERCQQQRRARCHGSRAGLGRTNPPRA